MILSDFRIDRLISNVCALSHHVVVKTLCYDLPRLAHKSTYESDKVARKKNGFEKVYDLPDSFSVQLRLCLLIASNGVTNVAGVPTPQVRSEKTVDTLTRQGVLKTVLANCQNAKCDCFSDRLICSYGNVRDFSLTPTCNNFFRLNRKAILMAQAAGEQFIAEFASAEFPENF